MRFGARVILLSLVGVVFALIPHADVEEQLSAAPSGDVVPVAPPAEGAADEGSESASNVLDFDAFLGGLQIPTPNASAVPAEEPVVAEVLGVSVAEDAPVVSADSADGRDAAGIDSTAAIAQAPDTSPEAQDAAEALPEGELDTAVGNEAAELSAGLLQANPEPDIQSAVAPATAPTVIEQAPTTVPATAALSPIETPTADSPDAEAPAPTETPTTAAPTTTSSTVLTTTTTLPPTTSPPTTAAPALADQALALVDFDWRRAFPNWIIEFHGERSGIRGLTYPAEKRVEIFIRPDDTAQSVLRILTHELGHVIDVELNSNEDRRRWAEQRGLGDDVPWWPSSEAPDFATGAGDFAEAFAVLETGIATRSTVAGQPSAADLALMRELILG